MQGATVRGCHRAAWPSYDRIGTQALTCPHRPRTAAQGSGPPDAPDLPAELSETQHTNFCVHYGGKYKLFVDISILLCSIHYKKIIFIKQIFFF